MFPALLEDGKPLFGYVAEGYWEDVGTLEAYIQAHQDVLDGQVALDIPGFQLGEGVWLGEGSEIDPGGQGRRPGHHRRLLPGRGRRPPARVHRARLQRAGRARTPSSSGPSSTTTSTSARACGCGAAWSAAPATCAGAPAARRAWSSATSASSASTPSSIPGVKVYPFKTVEPGAIVNSSIVWESRGARNLFGRLGVAGLANVDISPELAVRLAMAYGTTMKKGSTVVASRDTSRAARVLKRAMMVGLNAAGVNVSDLEVATIPLTRFHVRGERSQGGITVRLAPDDPQSVIIRFFDADGIDINEATQRKIERLFYREDFRRALAGEIGDIGFPPRTARVLHRGADGAGRRRGHPGRPASRSCSTTPTARPASSCPTCWPSWAPRCSSVNPYASTRQAAHLRPLASTPARWPSWSGRPAPTWARCIDSDGEHITLVDDTGHVLTDDEGLLALLRAGAR